MQEFMKAMIEFPLRLLTAVGASGEQHTVNTNSGAALGFGQQHSERAGGNFPGKDPTSETASPSGVASLSRTAIGSYASADTTSAIAVSDRDWGTLDLSRFMVVGDDLAAGIGDFGLQSDGQKRSFAAVAAQHMGASLKLPVVESPGLGSSPGMSAIPVRPPLLFQTVVREDFPACGMPTNLSVPGFTVSDCIRQRPAAPLVQRDARQTAVNLIIGLDALINERTPPTQLEAAVRQQPTLVLVALGANDVLSSALGSKNQGAFDVAAFSRDFATIVSALRSKTSTVVVATIPDPLDSARFMSLDAAERLLCVEPNFLGKAYGLAPDARLTVDGLFEVGCQINRKHFAPLSSKHILATNAVGRIAKLIAKLNDLIRQVAERHGAVVYDLCGFLREVRQNGTTVARRRLSGEYLGGFYSLNGSCPGWTGHALIAANLLDFLNNRFGTNFPTVDIVGTLNVDPVAGYRRAVGNKWSWESLKDLAVSARKPIDTCRERERAASVHSPATSAVSSGNDTADQQTPLQLPEGLEQILPLNVDLSYHGDAMRVMNCRLDREAAFGVCGNPLFGGLAMFGSHLTGAIRIRFALPQNGSTRFTVNLVDAALIGEDGILAAPQIFRFPILSPRVVESPGEPVCTGTLNLLSGEVSDLAWTCIYANSGLAAIAALNPRFPKQPIRFPGTYGSADARFQQRPDGKLDFVFHGSTFIPLGSVIPASESFVFPLPFCSSSQSFAGIPAHGTALHPHLNLSTEASKTIRVDQRPEIPANSVQEFVVCTNQSSFGDRFTLNAPELGRALGRSHVQGRVQIQFGERFGNSVPIHIALLPPAGLLDNPSLRPLQDQFPTRLSRGLLGHNEFLRFPTQSYYMDDVFLLEDPFDLALGAVDIRTGSVIGDLLHRGFIGQNMFFALVRVEPRTPKESFRFRGPAGFKRDRRGTLCYRFEGKLDIPYPAGFLFPNSNLSTGIVIGPDSALDPFMEIVAVHAAQDERAHSSGGAEGVVASTGTRFSYEYFVARDGRDCRVRFRYNDHSQNSQFIMHSGGVTAVTFDQSNSDGRNEQNMLTFAGFGILTAAASRSLRFANVQISTGSKPQYITIMIDGGRISNVNTSQNLSPTSKGTELCRGKTATLSK